MTTIVGSLGPGEACVNMGEGGSGRFAVNNTSSTASVYSDANTLHGLGRTAQYIAFLHTSFPTYGWVDASVLEDAYKLNFEHWGEAVDYYDASGPVMIDTWVVETNKTCKTYITPYEADPVYSLGAGAKILVNTMDVYNSGKTECQIYGYYAGSAGWITKDAVSDAWTIDTGIATGSGEAYWGIKLNR